MADTVDPKYLDKRTAERYLRNGQLDDKAYERHLKGLPDVADKASPVETAMDADDFDSDEDDIDEDDIDEGEEEEDEGDSEGTETP